MYTEKTRSKALIAGSLVFSVLFLFTILPQANLVQLFVQPSQADNTHIGGVFTAIVKDGDGNIVSIQQMPNLVPNEGLECTADLMFGTTSCTSEAFFTYIAIGTGAVAPADGDTTLGAESGTCARVLDSTPTLTSPSSGVRRIALSAVFSGASCEAQTFAETGVFDATTSGNMLARTLLSSTVTLPSGTGSTLTINYEVNLNN